MSGAILPVYRWQVFDGATPAAGAKLFSSLSGTSTPSPLYSDSAISTPLSNPVIADGSGVFPIMYMDALSYRILIERSDGTTLFAAQDHIYDFAELFIPTTASAHTFFGGPTSGAATTPAFRAIGPSDLQTGSWNVLTTAVSGTQNNFNPGLIGDTVIFCQNTAPLTLTGLIAGYQGQHVTFHTTSTGSVTFNYADSGSSAGNQFIVQIAPNNLTISQASVVPGSVSFTYVGTSWRQTDGVNQGNEISYTPTYGGGTIGNGSLTGTYAVIERGFRFKIGFIAGSTTTFGSSMSFAMPIAVTSSCNFSFVMVDDSGGVLYQGVAFIDGSGTLLTLYAGNSGVGGVLAPVTSTVPFTWATNDRLVINGMATLG